MPPKKDKPRELDDSPLKIQDLTIGRSLKHRNVNKWAPQWPFRLEMVGGSGSGKSNLAANMILQDMLSFDALYIYARNPDQPLYDLIREKIEAVVSETGVDITFVLENSLDKVVPIEQMNKDKQNLIIWDDWVAESDRVQNTIIAPFFVRSRHVNASNMYLSQSYSLTPVTIRRNLTHGIFFSSSRGRDLNLIWSDWAAETNKENFRRAFLQAVKEKYSFFTVDGVNPDLKYRKGLSQVLTIE